MEAFSSLVSLSITTGEEKKNLFTVRGEKSRLQDQSELRGGSVAHGWSHVFNPPHCYGFCKQRNANLLQDFLLIYIQNIIFIFAMEIAVMVTTRSEENNAGFSTGL